MGPACGLADPDHALVVRLVERPEPGIGVSLQNAGEVCQVLLRMFALAVGREEIGNAGRIFTAPRPVVAHIGPDPALPDAAILALGLDLRVEHPDRRVVGVQPIRREHILLDLVCQRAECPDRLAAPVDQRRARNVGAETGEDLALAIERQVIVELRDKNVCQQRGPGHPSRDRPRWRRFLGDPLATPAGLLQPHGLDDLQLRGHELEDLRDVLAQQPQLATTFRAGLAGVEHMTLTRCVLRDPRLAAPARGQVSFQRRIVGALIIEIRAGVIGGDFHLERFECQLELSDLAPDLLGTPPELLFPEPCDADLQGLDQGFIGLDGGLQPHRLGTLGQDHCLQRGNVIRELVKAGIHVPEYTGQRPTDP